MIAGGQTEARAQLSSTVMSRLTRAFVWHANYDRNSMNALRPRRFKMCDFSTNFL